MADLSRVTVLQNVRMMDGRLVDLEVRGGRIDSIRPPRTHASGVGIDCDGAYVLPGLADHHIHILALAAARNSVDCSPEAVKNRSALSRALHAAERDVHGWIRAIGYDQSTVGPLDVTVLDELAPAAPVRIQHRSGALWVLNSAALAQLDIRSAPAHAVERDHNGMPTGRIWRGDAWLQTQLPPAGELPLARLGTELSRLGLTEITDATPGVRDPRLIGNARAAGDIPQRITLLSEPQMVPKGITLGALKIVLGDTGLPSMAELIEEIARARRTGRPVAVHCVTREALVLVLVALSQTGAIPGDRIEHAAIVPLELIPSMRDLGLAVVTQPGFLGHRGDQYLTDVEAADIPHLYRHRTLLDAGVPTVASSDAPYGPVNPWQVMHDALNRRGPDGKVIGVDERVTAAQALAGYLCPPNNLTAVHEIASTLLGSDHRRELVRPTMQADLILTESPALEAVELGQKNPVVMTMIEGRVVSHA